MVESPAGVLVVCSDTVSGSVVPVKPRVPSKGAVVCVLASVGPVSVGPVSVGPVSVGPVSVGPVWVGPPSVPVGVTDWGLVFSKP